MDRAETRKFIDFVKNTFSNFQGSDSIVITWQEFFEEHKISFDDALRAAKQYRDSGEKYYPVPGEILVIIREWTKPKGAAYRPAETAYRGDPELLKRFPKLATYDDHTRQVLEASIRHRDAVRSGRVPPSPKSDPGKNETREVLAERERRIEQCHWESARGLDTSIEADALIYMQRVKDWFGFSTGNVPLPKGTTFRKDQPRKALPLPSPNKPQTEPQL